MFLNFVGGGGRRKMILFLNVCQSLLIDDGVLETLFVLQ